VMRSMVFIVGFLSLGLAHSLDQTLEAKAIKSSPKASPGLSFDLAEDVSTAPIGQFRYCVYEFNDAVELCRENHKQGEARDLCLNDAGKKLRVCVKNL